MGCQSLPACNGPRPEPFRGLGSRVFFDAFYRLWYFGKYVPTFAYRIFWGLLSRVPAVLLRDRSNWTGRLCRCIEQVRGLVSSTSIQKRLNPFILVFLSDPIIPASDLGQLVIILPLSSISLLFVLLLVGILLGKMERATGKIILGAIRVFRRRTSPLWSPSQFCESKPAPWLSDYRCVNVFNQGRKRLHAARQKYHGKEPPSNLPKDTEVTLANV